MINIPPAQTHGTSGFGVIQMQNPGSQALFTFAEMTARFMGTGSCAVFEHHVEPTAVHRSLQSRSTGVASTAEPRNFTCSGHSPPCRQTVAAVSRDLEVAAVVLPRSHAG